MYRVSCACRAPTRQMKARQLTLAGHRKEVLHLKKAAWIRFYRAVTLVIRLVVGLTALLHAVETLRR